MSGFKNFAVAGAGNIGKVISEELLRKKEAGEISSVVILSRSADSHEDLKSKGAKIVAVDYTSSASLESALAGVDVVISSLSEGFDETGVAIAAKAAGVKLFVPSDYAVGPTEGHEDDQMFKCRMTTRRKLKEIQLPYAVFWPGFFHDMMLAPLYSETIGLNFQKGEFTIQGSGTAPISWTASNDVARFVVHALINLPREKLEWRAFPIEADRASYNDILESWKKRTGKTVTVSHRPRSELEEDARKKPDDLWSPIFLAVDEGRFVVGKPDELANDELPGWKPRKIVDVLADLYEQ